MHTSQNYLKRKLRLVVQPKQHRWRCPSYVERDATNDGRQTGELFTSGGVQRCLGKQYNVLLKLSWRIIATKLTSLVDLRSSFRPNLPN
jgi:hypothetical protein